MQLAPEVLGVPLIIRTSSESLEPGRYEKVTRSIDVFPTMLGLSGLSVPDGRPIQGIDLSPVLMGRRAAPDLLAYSHTTVLPRSVFKQMHSKEHSHMWTLARRFFPTQDADLIWVAVRDGDMLYESRSINGSSWGFRAYDLNEYPSEARNLYDADDPAHVERTKKLSDYKARLVKRYAALKRRAAGRSLLEAEEAETLRALGYIE